MVSQGYQYYEERFRLNIAAKHPIYLQVCKTICKSSVLNNSVNNISIHQFPSILFFLMFQVHITVMDNNDHAPIFSQSTYEVTISEDTPPDSEVVQVLASDRDEYHRLTYSLPSSIDPNSVHLFRIHPILGTIYTAQRLDHEACAQHILTVMVCQCHCFYHFLKCLL